MSSPIYVAIDTPDLAKAQHLAGQVRNHVGGLKWGWSSSAPMVIMACMR